ncbi:MAG: hypothetical protein H6Q90_5194 [Deltaproteobacteria bacterium]|nr:hypothetical protein [Deltaproteobacteria bacterium]
MSALPKPEADQPPEPGSAAAADAEGWALLEGLRRRLDDQASQGRKTQHQVSQLTESIAALVEVQRRRTRGINLNSFVAYTLFTLLCGGGFYLLYRSRANDLVESREQVLHERDTAVRRADELSVKSVARDQADARTWEVYQLLDAGRRGEAASKLAAMKDLPLSRTERSILAARAHETQVMEVDAALKAAAASFKAGQFAELVGPLEAALLVEPTGPRAASMHYFLGIAYAKLGALDKAVSNLQTSVAANVEHDDAGFQLASALDRSGAYARARAEYDRFATAHPQSPFAVYAMRRSATLARMPAIAPPPAETAPTSPEPPADSPQKPAVVPAPVVKHAPPPKPSVVPPPPKAPLVPPPPKAPAGPPAPTAPAVVAPKPKLPTDQGSAARDGSAATP